MTEVIVSPLTIHLFGAFHARCGGMPLPPLRSQKGKWLLALLILRHGKDLQRAWVADQLWPDNDKAQTSLNSSVFDLRNALGDEAKRLPRGGRTLRLDLANADVDVIRFDAAIQRGDLPSLREAIDLYAGPLMEDCSEPWILPEREQRTNAYITALETLATQALTDGDCDDALVYLHRAVSVEVIRERMHRLLMKTLADGGDYPGAIQVYRNLTERLQKEALRSPEEATATLYRHIRQRAKQRATVPAPVAAPITAAALTNVLRPLTALLGREKELQSIVARLPSARLITLTGPGGVGKTRLATEAALEIAPAFAHGAHLVTLEALTDPELIPQQVAKTLGIDGQPGRTWNEALVHFLRGREMLLVLDNCEHLLDACADLARKLLGVCPGLHLLVTSRERLRLTGEIVRPIPPLTVPDPDFPLDVSQCLDYSAIHLFCERATAVRPDFEMSPENAREVVSICRHLDGLPLAIELAAALVETLSVREIVGHLDQRFRLLKAGDRTASPRHQALKATLDWSYDQLTPDEQALLCRLCVFAEGWTLAAAEALFLTQPGKIPQVFASLSRLVAKSLVLAEVNQAETRYGMLETIREYGREVLTAPAVWESICQAHCEYYTALAESTAAGLLGASQVDSQNRLEREHANLRAALSWTIGGAGDPCLALRLGGALWRFWYAQGYHIEGQNWLKRILQMSSGQPASLRLDVTRGLGNLYYVQTDYAAARPCFEQFLTLAQELKDRRAEASALASLANIEVGEQNFSRARKLFESALHRFEELEDTRGKALTYSNLAMLACRSKKDYVAARALHMRSLALFRELGALYDIAHECNNLVHTLLHLKEINTAYVTLDESVAMSRTLANPFLLAHSLTNYTGIAILEGRLERAAVLMGADAALRAKIDSPLPPEAISEHKNDEQKLRAHFGTRAFETHLLRGQKMTEEEMRAYAVNRSE